MRLLNVQITLPPLPPSPSCWHNVYLFLLHSSSCHSEPASTSRPVQLKAIILLTDILHEQVCLVLNHENLPMFLALSATRNMATGVRVHILVTSVHYTNILIWF